MAQKAGERKAVLNASPVRRSKSDGVVSEFAAAVFPGDISRRITQPTEF